MQVLESKLIIKRRIIAGGGAADLHGLRLRRWRIGGRGCGVHGGVPEFTLQVRT